MGGRDKHNFLSGGAFRKAKYEKLRRRKKKWRKRGRAKIPSPPNPLPFCPPERQVSFLPREARQSKFAVRIFFKKSSDFNQKAPPSQKQRPNLGRCFCIGGHDLRNFEPRKRLKFEDIDKSIQELRAIYKVHPEWFEVPKPKSDKGKNEVDYSI
ncbi:MAG: hypothetical protein A2857_07055 [Candidatus Levybacteria bacterium RIFCSPHIGHO2_01_FULL_36_15]|nr:MAG: hypothetical protein A2857_07055 [Candidatus Levybacteria bacterium RIFCSPHIGHO2_01_FULL_36_15]